MPDPSIFTSVINGYLPEPHASLLNGIVLGINLKAAPELYNELKIAGLLHIVVLSGMNITIMAAAIAAVTASFGKRISLMLTFLALTIFIIFLGPKAPIIRAGFMGFLTIVAILLGKRNIAVYALFISAVLTALFWPHWLKTVSFQLSYAATLGIILFGYSKLPKPKNLLEKVIYGARRELRISLSAQLFTVPIIFLYFRQVSLISPLSNVLIAPIIAPLTLFGLLTAVLGKIHFALGILPSYVCLGLLSYLLAVVENVSALPYAFFSF